MRRRRDGRGRSLRGGVERSTRSRENPISSTDESFVAQSRAYLASEYRPKILRCLGELTEKDVWWRPNASSNSVGNLVLHLCGNIRQWVVSGIGGEPDVRDRAAEFAAHEGADRKTLAELLETTLADVDRVLAALPLERLSEPLVIQGMDVTVQSALYHVVEHFAGHTYQIVYITKMRTGRDLAFYVVEDGVVRETW